MGSEPIAGLAASIYTLALLATIPVGIATIAAWALRDARAEARVLVWRSAVIAIVALVAARALPIPTVSWSVPALLAAPLVALGRLQVTVPAAGLFAGGAAGNEMAITVRALLVAYFVGVGVVLLPTVAGLLRAHAVRRSAAVAGGEWRVLLRDALATTGVRVPVTLLESSRAGVPMTWGWRRPVIVVPRAARRWTASQRRTVLLHELQHVGAGDWPFALVARCACAVFWFHPGVWCLMRGLREDCELACDDRVIAAGVRRSDYAELLITASDHRHAVGAGALALSGEHGLRARLRAVLDRRRDVSPLGRRWRFVAASCTLLVAAPVSIVQLAPTRAVLTTLLRDSRWESRAYAVIGLAKRPDTLAVARAAAARDPNPHVRALAVRLSAIR